MHENLPTSILSEIEILRFDLRHCLTDELFDKVIDTVRFAYDEGKKEGL